MKKAAFPLIYTIVLILTSSNTANTQKNAISFNSPALENNFLSPFEKMGFEETKANNININAVRDFVKTFKNIGNNKWYRTKDGGFTSAFTSDEIETTVAYNTKGVRKYIIRIYKENNLPFEIRDMVKREYYDATITLVREVKTDLEMIFFVHLRDKYTWKIVKVADGEMKLVQNLIKG